MGRLWALGTACVLLLAACDGDVAEPSAGEEDEQQEQQDTAAATITSADSSLGEIIVDDEGMTLYMFVPDQEEDGEPTCYEDCAATWPPLEATGDLQAGEGLDPSLLGSVERTDGITQVTYNNLPLYNFSGDEAAGETNGQGLNDVWWVMSPDGEPIME